MDVPPTTVVQSFHAEDNETPYDNAYTMSTLNKPRHGQVLAAARLRTLADTYLHAALEAAYPKLDDHTHKLWMSYFTTDLTQYRVVPGGIPDAAIEHLSRATKLGLTKFSVIRHLGTDETIILGTFREDHFPIVTWRDHRFPAVTKETLEAHYATIQAEEARREAAEMTRYANAALERDKEALKTKYLAYPTWIAALASLAVINYLFYTLIGGWVLAPASVSALFCAGRIDASRFHFINSRRKLVRKIAIPLLILNLLGGAGVWLTGAQLGVSTRTMALCSEGPNYEYSTDGQTYFTPDGKKYTLTLRALDELDGYPNIVATVTYVKHGLYGAPEVTAITHVQNGSEACYPAEAPLPL